MKRKYKLIKEYPGSGKIGTIVQNEHECSYEQFPEFWREIKEEEFKKGDWVWSNTPNVQKDRLGGDKGFIGKIIEISHGLHDPFKISVSTKLYHEYTGSLIKDNEGYVWCNECRKATKEELLDFLIKESGFEIGDKVEYNGGKRIIKSFRLYNEGSGDSFSMACDEYWEKTKCWFLVIKSGAHSLPADECKKIEKIKKKKLTLSDGRIIVVINSKGEIIADGNKFDIADIRKIYDVMLGMEFQWSNELDYSVSFPNVRIGCATFHYSEIAEIITKYEELNGK